MLPEKPEPPLPIEMVLLIGLPSSDKTYDAAAPEPPPPEIVTPVNVCVLPPLYCPTPFAMFPSTTVVLVVWKVSMLELTILSLTGASDVNVTPLV